LYTRPPSPDAINHLIIKLSPTRIAQTNQIAILPMSAVQYPVFDPVPFHSSQPFSPSSTSKSSTLLSTFIGSPKKTYTFPAHYTMFHWPQLIVIAPPTIMNLRLTLSSSPCSIIAPTIISKTCPSNGRETFAKQTPSLFYPSSTLQDLKSPQGDCIPGCHPQTQLTT
jgi:hypothetical protein